MSNQLAKMRYKFYFLTMPKLNKSPRKTVWNTRNAVSSPVKPQRSRAMIKARPWQPLPFREMPCRSPRAGIRIWLDPKSSAHMTSRFLPAKILPFPAHKSTNGMTTPSRSRSADKIPICTPQRYQYRWYYAAFHCSEPYSPLSGQCGNLSETALLPCSWLLPPQILLCRTGSGNTPIQFPCFQGWFW